METWIGIDFSLLVILMFLGVGVYVTKLKDRVDELENELENLKFDIRNLYPVTGFETERQFCLARVLGSS